MRGALSDDLDRGALGLELSVALELDVLYRGLCRCALCRGALGGARFILELCKSNMVFIKYLIYIKCVSFKFLCINLNYCYFYY